MSEFEKSLASEITGSTHWLQLFAEGDPAPVQTPAAAPAQAPQGVQSPAPDLQTPVQAPSQEFLDFGGRKVPATAETRAVYEDWKNQQSALTRAQQEAAQLRQQAIRAVPTQQPAPAQQEVAPSATAQQQASQVAQAIVAGLNPEQRTALNAQLSAGLFSDDPVTALEQVLGVLVTPTIQQLEAKIQAPLQQVQAIQAERAWDNQVSTFAAGHPDFTETIPAIQQVLTQNPYLYNAPNGLEAAYLMAKGLTAQPVQSAPTLEQILQQPGVVEQLVNNPTITNQILARHAENIAKGAPPPVITAQAPGVIPVQPANAPKTMKEATDQLMAQWAATGGPR